MKKQSYKGLLLFDNQGRSFANGKLQPDWYVHAFMAREFSGEIGLSKEGTLVWIHRSRLDDIAMHEADRVFISWLDREGIFSARFCYEDKTLTSYEATFYLPTGEIEEKTWER